MLNKEALSLQLQQIMLDYTDTEKWKDVPAEVITKDYCDKLATAIYTFILSADVTSVGAPVVVTSPAGGNVVPGVPVGKIN